MSRRPRPSDTQEADAQTASGPVITTRRDPAAHGRVISLLLNAAQRRPPTTQPAPEARDEQAKTA